MACSDRDPASQSEFTIPYHISRIRGAFHWWIWFGLRWLTIPYHRAILGQTLPRATFTNPYHLTITRGIIDCYNGLGTVIDCG